MPVLVDVGVVELTTGVLTGWAMVYIDDEDRVRRSAISDPRRIRQGHLDLLMMGAILTAIGAAVSDPPAFSVVLLIFGSWIAPLLFFPLAFRPSLGGHMLYHVLDLSAFVALTLGYAILAIEVLSR
ncbi:MAG: hypothetical protein ACRDL0_09055 [Thermoleophilaceae bacterium]